MHGKYIRRLTTFALLFLVAVFTVTYSSFGDNTKNDDRIVRLGNPFADDGHTGRALNAWDLQVFEGKVYVAGGSTVTNSGPINVWAYNPNTRTFEKEYKVREEAIEHYKVFEDRLYIPAADPRNADKTKYYRKNAGGKWRKYASDEIKLAHVRDLIETKDDSILLVGNNRRVNKDISAPSIAIATDDGTSFQGAGIENVPMSGKSILVDFNWFLAVFSYKNKIYAPTTLLRDVENYANTIAVYDETKQKFVLDPNLKNDEFIPARQIGMNRSKQGMYVIYRIWNPVEFQDYLIYSVRSYSNNSQNYEKAYMNSLGMYIKKDMGKTPKRLRLPRRAIGEDLLVMGDELYVLANRKKFGDRHIISVYKTSNPNNRRAWKEVLSFESTNKARSFEFLEGKFYFGLGQDYGEAIANSGDILTYTQPPSSKIQQ